MAREDSEEFAERIRRDPHEHGGMPEHLDDEQLARLTEEERAALGLEPYDPYEVPPATDVPLPPPPITETEQYQEERAEILREEEKGELIHKGEHRPFPPTRYE